MTKTSNWLTISLYSTPISDVKKDELQKGTLSDTGHKRLHRFSQQDDNPTLTIFFKTHMIIGMFNMKVTFADILLFMGGHLIVLSPLQKQKIF